MLTFSTSFISVNFWLHSCNHASDSFKLVKIDFNKAVFLNSKNNSELLRGVIEFRLVSNVIKSNAFLKNYSYFFPPKEDLLQMFC
jgi:hypothetical protein